MKSGDQTLAVLNRVSRAAQQLNAEADRVKAASAKKTDEMVIRDVRTILPPRWKTGTGYVKMQDIKKEALFIKFMQKILKVDATGELSDDDHRPSTKPGVYSIGQKRKQDDAATGRAPRE